MMRRRFTARLDTAAFERGRNRQLMLYESGQIGLRPQIRFNGLEQGLLSLAVSASIEMGSGKVRENVGQHGRVASAGERN